MNLFNYINYNFTFDFFQKRIIHPFYQTIHNKITNEKFINKNFEGFDFIKNNIHEIKFIPEFFQLEYPKLTTPYKVIKFKRVENFSINFEGYKTIEDFLISQMGPKSRSQLRRRIHRLENCFDVSYKFYYGEISKEKYDLLFKVLEKFIDQRFKQRQEIFSLNNYFDDIKQRAYEMILEKKASLLVIYANSKPIDICLSYHFQNIMHHLIRSYDIDYSKFWIGQIDIYKQVEWCLANNFTVFDLMWGELVYKKRWCNSTSLYEHHFIYKSTNPTKRIFVLLLMNLYTLHDRLKEKKIYKWVKKLKEHTFNNVPKEKTLLNIKTENIQNLPSIESLMKINIETEEFSFLRKTTFDFQYLNFDTTENTTVFQLKNEKNGFIIKGSKQQIKVTVT